MATALHLAPRDTAPSRLRSYLNEGVLVLFIFSIGIRLVAFASNRSLWIDEAMLAENILNRSWEDLLTPLDYYQIAPIGFLWAVKAMTLALGPSEYALRLVPLCAGVLSCWMLYRLTHKILPHWVLLLFMGLFGFCEPIIYYAQELKQYATDVFLTLWVFYLGRPLLTQGFSQIKYWRLVAVLCLGSWFSHAMLMVGLGVLLLLIFQILTLAPPKEKPGDKSHWHPIPQMILGLVFFLANFTLEYQWLLAPLHRSAAHQEIWHQVWDQQLQAFMPLPWQPQWLPWLWHSLFSVMKHPVGLRLSFIPGVLFLLGIIGTWVAPHFHKSPSGSNPYDFRPLAALALSPLVITLVASGAHLYPFLGRMLLFLVPTFLLMICLGGYYFVIALPSIVQPFKKFTGSEEAQKRYWLFAPIILSIVLGIGLIHAPKKLIAPTHEEMKPVLETLAQKVQPEDALYIYYGAQPAFQYYIASHGLGNPTLEKPLKNIPRIEGTYQSYVDGLKHRNKPHAFSKTFQPLKTLHPKRLWVLLSHLYQQEEQDITQELSAWGKPVTILSGRHAKAMAYDITPAVKPNP
ncbi:MAG: hypothetical protein K2X66_08910 [Cyanobacteria bacterium]|nr:hypothetical protein [Cyanobacteriota bacterium]